MARTVSSIAKYAYGDSEDTAYCHLYLSGEVDFGQGFTVSCQTEYPRGFAVVYRVVGGSKKLAVRIPGWSRSFRILKNSREYHPEIKKGYAYFPALVPGDTIELLLDERPYFVYPSQLVPEDSGRAALKRGPLVYCFEGVDNDGDVLSLSLDTDGEVTPGESPEGLPETVGSLYVKGFRRSGTDGLYTFCRPRQSPCILRAVPYYAWANRGENQMRVWLPYRI